MDAELKRQAESYLGTEIKQSEWDSARAYAGRKLKLIIEREGDLDGERRKPYYIAQLIAEAVRSDRFSNFTFELSRLYRQADEYAEQMGIKKEQPVSI
ncbi:MAG: hypothetical protein LUG26_07480 [Ruminococcus sp.]|nr:hypothetical protein [Ruminococcus sp.]